MGPVTVTYKELGIDIPELEEAARPFTERKGIPVGTGRSKTIIKAGQFQGDFEGFLKSRDKKYQMDHLGKNRYELWKSGAFEFSQLVDGNGKLRLLRKDKKGNYVGLKGIR